MICPYMFVNTCTCTYMMYEPLIEFQSKIQDLKRKELKTENGNILDTWIDCLMISDDQTRIPHLTETKSYCRTQNKKYDNKRVIKKYLNKKN